VSPAWGTCAYLRMPTGPDTRMPTTCDWSKNMSESSKRPKAASQQQGEVLLHCRLSPQHAPPLAACKADGGPPCETPAEHDGTRPEVARKHEQYARQAANLKQVWTGSMACSLVDEHLLHRIRRVLVSHRGCKTLPRRHRFGEGKAAWCARGCEGCHTVWDAPAVLLLWSVRTI
jgi:hypothetical protein